METFIHALGPVGKAPKFPCVHCKRGVRANTCSKAVSCDICENWIHIKCGDVAKTQYDNAVSCGQQIPFVCNKCSFLCLPLPDDVTDLSISNESGENDGDKGCDDDPVSSNSNDKFTNPLDEGHNEKSRRLRIHGCIKCSALPKVCIFYI